MLDQVSVYLLVCCVMAVAAALQSVTGFGFNLIAIPLLTIVLEPRLVVPAAVVAWLPLGLALAIRFRSHISLARVCWLMIGAVPGLVVGAWLLGHVNASILRRFIGTVVIVSTVALVAKPIRPLRHERPWVLLAGTLSGILGGSTAMSGPPVLLLGLNQSWEPSGFRADLIVYFSLLSVILTGVFAWQNLLSVESLKLSGMGIPGLILGYISGVKLASRVTARSFRWLVVCLLCLAGLLPWIIGT